MSNPFQEQLLKAGIVSKQQVQKANKDKHKKKKQKSSKKDAPVIDETKLAVQQAAREKAELDRQLNKKKEDEARKKAVSVEIDQLITNNRIERGDDCDVAYNFSHAEKVNRIYISKEMQQQISKGKLGIARINGKYELVPKHIAEKIQQRNENRVVLFNDEQLIDEDDEYADYQIPDDLIW